MDIVQDQLVDFEKFVNDRRLSSPPADLSPDLVPETSTFLPMQWVVLPAEEVKFITEHGEGKIPLYGKNLLGHEGRVVFFPIHPLQIKEYKKKKIITSGTARVSSSYRTFFYEPDIAKNIANLGPLNDNILMLKLHLDNPIPGVAGDRRLTYDKVKKSVDISRELSSLEKRNKLSHYLSIIPEEIGLVHENRGAIIRKIPKHPLVPAFSLTSPDQRDHDKEILAVTILKNASRVNGQNPIDLFTSIFVKPLVESLFSAFEQGFSLEMHMQNVLFYFNDRGQTEKIFYRDMEGVVFSNKYRASRGLPKLFKYNENPELLKDEHLFPYFFNRNLDHDIGRIIQNLLYALRITGFFSNKEILLAKKYTKRVIRSSIKKYGFEKFSFWNNLLKISRSPYGNGTRIHHYYFCRFR